jgi:hypothetical protein
LENSDADRSFKSDSQGGSEKGEEEIPHPVPDPAHLPEFGQSAALTSEASEIQVVANPATIGASLTADSKRKLFPRAQPGQYAGEGQYPGASEAAAASVPSEEADASREVKVPRRKPGARECMQISRRFGVRVIPDKYVEIMTDYCKRGKVEHLIRMRERLDEHSRYLEAQLAGLEALVKTKGESDVVVPLLPEGPDRKLERTIAGDMGFDN